jgi:hypothetical protein
MELIKKDSKNFIFQFSKRERGLLLDILDLYPLVPDSYHKISKSGGMENVEEAQQMLEEALAERKKENKKLLERLLSDPNRLKTTAHYCRWLVPVDQAEWLLQVFNDIRVGSWFILGCPDPGENQPIQIDEKNARYYVAMEVCGYFQSVLLESL